METNEKREIVSQGRIPTQRSYNVGPKVENVNAELKDYKTLETIILFNH